MRDLQVFGWRPKEGFWNIRRILGWDGYGKGLRRAFESFTSDTGIAVSFHSVRNQDEMHHVAGTEAFNVACPTTDRLASWLDSSLIAPLDEDRIGFSRIDPTFHADAQTVIHERRYGSPNIWGGVPGLGTIRTAPRWTLPGSA
ncbi:hypothetical protein [Tabrizicola sp. BL-A-41-H6]|uniref:hypothetical protein n=1 Tax=Tabrizicola sp. BL-A-41-H6 TaxID=3421107 RepID=UPI003D667877